jgi:RHS repeat-associated protein
MSTASQLSENSHQGFDGLKAALCLGSRKAKSNAASGMPVCLWRNGIGSRSSGKERDETGLDYFGARYFSAPQGRFTSVDPVWVKADRIVDPQRLNLYAYGRNNPLKFSDPTGMDITIGACPGGDPQKCFDVVQRGLRKEDRSHVHLVAGDGKNGFKKGEFGITADKDYKSSSENFQVLKSLAGDHSAMAQLSVVGPKVQIEGFIGIKNAAGNVELKTFREAYGANLTLEQGWLGQTLFQNWGGKVVEGDIFSKKGFTEAYVGTDQSTTSMIQTMSEELRHIFLGDFGRIAPKSDHGQPGVNESIKRAKIEAEINAGQK